ncbi:MAG TPA: DNA-processing protein DprA [Hyphomicrobiaceae bacterium]|nr:DNA-processing protein DprA [Hyphomicrobiaceae bacterium]
MAPSHEQRARLTPAPLPQAPLDHAQRLACLRLIRSDNVGPVTFRELINRYGGAEQALEALPELARRGGRQGIRLCPRAAAEAELEAAERIGARPLFTIEPGYPAALASIEAPPPLLYVKGNTGHLVRPTVAIVGARNGSAAGQKLARLFADRIGGAGFVIASGLARGIDAAAHEAALPHGTVAVLAGGIDTAYPPENAALQQRIGEVGCLLSENPPGFQVRARDFPRRNRIISGVSLGVVIIEAAQRSGTLITARRAAEQGREVFAIPGHPLDPRAEGTNRLLKGGATMVTEPDEVLDALAPMLREAPAPPLSMEPPSSVPQAVAPSSSSGQAPLAEDERARILAALGPAPIDIDELARATGLPARALRIALLELSLAGRIEHHGHQLVSLKTPE